MGHVQYGGSERWSVHQQVRFLYLLNRARLNMRNDRSLVFFSQMLIQIYFIDIDPEGLQAFLNLGSLKHFVCRTVRALELDNLPVVGFRFMYLHHNTEASLSPQCKCKIVLVEHGDVECFRTLWLLLFPTTDGAPVQPHRRGHYWSEANSLQHLVILSNYCVAGVVYEVCLLQANYIFHANLFLLTWPHFDLMK